MQKMKITFAKAMQVFLIAAGVCILAVGALSYRKSVGGKYQSVSVDGRVIGHTSLKVPVWELFLQARRELAEESDTRICLDYKWDLTYENKLFTPLMNAEEMKAAIKAAIAETLVSAYERVYTVAIEDYRANFKTMEEVRTFLQQVKAPADEADAYEVFFSKDGMHIGGILDAALNEAKEAQELPKDTEESSAYAGAAAELSACLKGDGGEKAYRRGVLDIDFIEKVEVYENYVAKEELSDMEEAVTEVTKQKESNRIYVVEGGDCLSVIAMDHEITVDSIMALNGLKNADVIKEGQELIIAVPEPDLQIRLTVGEVYEEDYEEEPVIIENDSWYTTKEVVLEEGSTGHRERNDIVVYENGLEVSRNMAAQTIMVESKATVIERGTIKPPTYIKPLYGGRFSSGYGRRWGRMHRGVDYACPIGTTVFASSAGTVVAAGYNSGGYGNQVVISHPDGRMTRYAHNSKLLVRIGQHVEQGEAIALSGNTGRSTGPHVHFEIIINGSQVDPLKYIN